MKQQDAKTGANDADAANSQDTAKASPNARANAPRAGRSRVRRGTRVPPNVSAQPRQSSTVGRLEETETAPTPRRQRNQRYRPVPESRRIRAKPKGVTANNESANDTNQPVKPILKESTDEVPSASNVKKPKKIKRQTSPTKNVNIAREHDTMQLKELTDVIQSTTITGFRELSIKNFLVLLGFWFMRFFIPWIEAWHEFNFYLLREPSYWDPVERSTRTGEVIIFIVRCIATICISVFADLINLKFYIYLNLMLLFVLCPVIGAFFNGALVTRSYDVDYYSKWAFTTDLMFHGAFALAYVAFPIQLSCIFSQEHGMSRQAHYNWTAVFVLLESVNRYICFWIIPGKCPTRTFTQTAIWFVIGVAIFIASLLLINFIFRWLNHEVVTLNRFWIKSTLSKERVDINFKTMLSKPIWFTCILTCLVVTAIVFAALERLKPDENWDKHYVLSATSMFVFGEILGAVVMSSISTLIRWKKPKPKYRKYLHPDQLALGVPHLINCLALLVLFGRFAALSKLEKGEVVVGPIPEKAMMVVEFYNFDYRNRTICVHSEFFRPLKIGPRERGTREIQDPGPKRVYFKVTTDPIFTPSVSKIESFEYQDGRWATFIITLPVAYMSDADFMAVVRRPEIIRVEGTQFLRPSKEPRINFMNTFAFSNKSNWTFHVSEKESGFSREFQLMVKWHTVVLEVPAGRIEVSYELLNSSVPSVTDFITIETHQYCVYSLLLGHARPRKPGETAFTRMLKYFLTMQIAGPDSKNVPNKAQLQRDVAFMVGMTLAGMASSGFFIGFVYLFWLDTPFVAYRTTAFAMFWVCLQIPKELAKIKAIDIGPIIISTLLFLQTICVIVHFVSAYNLYSPSFNFRRS